jgi:hypothetical protein
MNPWLMPWAQKWGIGRESGLLKIIVVYAYACPSDGQVSSMQMVLVPSFEP